jgi:hypothetical protein
MTARIIQALWVTGWPIRRVATTIQGQVGEQVEDAELLQLWVKILSKNVCVMIVQPNPNPNVHIFSFSGLRHLAYTLARTPLGRLLIAVGRAAPLSVAWLPLAGFLLPSSPLPQVALVAVARVVIGGS